MLKLTPEQEAMISECSTHSETSFLVSALAGSAKTTTLALLAERLDPAKPTLALAFNVHSKEDLSKKLPSWIKVQTLNGYGHAAWGRFLPCKATLSKNKVWDIINLLNIEDEDDRSIVASLINAARNEGLVPDGVMGQTRKILRDDEESWEYILERYDILAGPEHISLARDGLITCITQGLAGNIDFADQLYLPVILHAPFPRYHTILVDEAQDLSPLNHIMLRNAKRIIAVGDANQAIYGFRGAAYDSLSRIAQDFSTTPLTLNTCFRCPKAVVAEARKYAPEMVAWEGSPVGMVDALSEDEWLSSLHSLFTVPSTAILCRNNAPLFRMALFLLQQGIGCHVLGRDIGKNLQRTLTKVVGKNKNLPIDHVRGMLSAWRADNEKSPSIQDKYHSFEALIDGGDLRTLGQLHDMIEKLFKERENVTVLATGHKAKGLEWDHVFHLDAWRIPSQFATTPEQIRQERNLAYVITTRARKTLTYINLPRRK